MISLLGRGPWLPPSAREISDVYAVPEDSPAWGDLGALHPSLYPEPIRAQLETHGVEPGDVGLRYGAGGNGPSMYVKDPDGNTVELKGAPNA